MKKTNFMLMLSAILGLLSVSTVKTEAHSKSTTNLSNSLISQKYSPQTIPTIDHIKAVGDGKVSIYLTSPISTLEYQCNLIYKDTDNSEQGIGNPDISSDGREYLSFTINLSQIIPIEKQLITKSLAFKMIDKTTGITTEYAVNNKDLLEVIENTMSDPILDPLVSGDDVITGTATTGARLLLQNMDIDGEKLIGTAVAADNKFRIQLPHASSGLDNFFLSFAGRYGEIVSKNIVTATREKGENLFYNPDMSNNAYGWSLLGPKQTITSDDEGAVFTLDSGKWLGACQFKYTSYLGYCQISFDIKPESLKTGENSALLLLGHVSPGGLHQKDSFKQITLTQDDLGKWQHVEYTIREIGVPLTNRYGFAVENLSQLKLKNVNLKLLDQ